MKPFLLSIILALLTFSSTAQARFRDVTRDHPYWRAIDFILKQDIVHGYPDLRFIPDAVLNRAEFTKIIIATLYPETFIDACIEALPQLKQRYPHFAFRDVDYDSWYGKYVCAAQLTGIIQGHPDGTFKPGERVNMAQTAKILSEGFSLITLEEATRHPGPRWHDPYMQRLADLKFIPPSVAGPAHYLNRGELAELIYRIFVYQLYGRETKGGFLSYRDITYDIIWALFKERPYGYSIRYPSVWPEPHVLMRGAFDRKEPRWHSLRRIYFGQEKHCPGFGSCIERDFYLDIFPKELAEEAIARMRWDTGITVFSDRLKGDARILIFEEEANGCVDKAAFIVGPQYLYRLTARCGVPSLEYEFDQLLGTFELIQ